MHPYALTRIARRYAVLHLAPGDRYAAFMHAPPELQAHVHPEPPPGKSR